MSLLEALEENMTLLHLSKGDDFSSFPCSFAVSFKILEYFENMANVG